MAKALVVILVGSEGHENVGRLVNGLETAKEFAEHDGDEVELVFDGAGTERSNSSRWAPTYSRRAGSSASTSARKAARRSDRVIPAASRSSGAKWNTQRSWPSTTGRGHVLRVPSAT